MINHLATAALPRRTKLLYGLGDWGPAAATTARSAFWFLFLTSVVGLDAALVGSIFLVGKLWDGVNDPLVGTLSDRLRSRWGRRKPFLLFGAVPFGLAFLLTFLVPSFEGPLALAFYYGFVFLLFDTLYTIVNVPYTALTAELTRDYDERSSLAGWRIGVSILAALVTGGAFKLLAEGVFAGWFGGGTAGIRAGYALAAAIWGISFMIPLLVLGLRLKEPAQPAMGLAPIRPVQTFRQVFSNRPFRLAAIIYLLSFVTADVVLAVFVRFLIDYVRVEPGYDNIILAVVLGIAFLSMPLVVWLMRRYGKRETFIGSMLFLAVVLVIIALTPPGGQNMVTIAALFAGLGYGAANAVPWAIVADVVEADELRTGERREGIYAGYLVFFRKLASAIALFLVGQILSWSGFVSSTAGSAFVEQPASALLALRFLVGVFPAIMLLLAILAAWRYPLDRARHEAIRRELAERET